MKKPSKEKIIIGIERTLHIWRTNYVFSSHQRKLKKKNWLSIFRSIEKRNLFPELQIKLKLPLLLLHFI